MSSDSVRHDIRPMIAIIALAGTMFMAGGGLALAGGDGGGNDMAERSATSQRGADRSATRSAASVMGLMGDAGERVIVIDVRPKADFAKGHLRGAINLQLARATQVDKSVLGSDKAARIVVYGANERDEAASQMVRAIAGEGFTNVIWMRGGFAEWVTAQLPVDKTATQSATN